MVRSLSMLHLFVVLAVGYIGGVLLYRVIPGADFPMIVRFYDGRAATNDSTSLIIELTTVVSFFVLAAVLAMFKKTRYLVMLVGAFKSVLFGLASAHILALEVNMLVYAGWWFPFHLVATFLVLLFCWTISPPFFTRRPSKRQMHFKGPLMLFGASLVVFVVDKVVYSLLAG
ncbi:hypothetical protein [Sporosarcina sp. A2]|uniref:hypothetical protein n=1 Tax=Sporosarcina sp. A2 TaxID=3393449 RepID=UPI003D79F4B8